MHTLLALAAAAWNVAWVTLAYLVMLSGEPSLLEAITAWVMP